MKVSEKRRTAERKEWRNALTGLNDELHVVSAHLQQILGHHGPPQLAVEQLPVEEQPGTAHEEGDGGTAGVVGQQRHLDALHEECGQLDPPGRHQVQLEAGQAVRVQQLRGAGRHQEGVQLCGYKCYARQNSSRVV